MAQNVAIWAQLAIAAAAVVLGAAVALLLALIDAMLLHWVNPANAAPPPVFVGINLARKLPRKAFRLEGAPGWFAGEQRRNKSARSTQVDPAQPAVNRT